MRKNKVRDESGTDRSNHVIAEQKVTNEGIILQAGHQLRDVGWAEDPSKVSTKVLSQKSEESVFENE